MPDNRLGILIPTSGRYQFLRHLLPIYSKSPRQVVIFLGDCNNDDSTLDFCSWLNFRNFKNVKYYSFPKFSIGKTLYELAKIAKKEVSYLTLSGDDDFVFPEFFPLAQKILKNRPDVKSVQGRAIIAEVSVGKGKMKLRRFGEYWKSPARIENSIDSRLLLHSKNYFVANFSIQKSADYFKNVKNYVLATSSISNFWQEYIESFSIIANGKSVFLDSPHIVRGVHKGRSKIVSGSLRDSQDYIYGRKYFSELMLQNLKFDGKKTVKLIINNLEIANMKKVYWFKNLPRDFLGKIIFAFFPELYLRFKKNSEREVYNSFYLKLQRNGFRC